MEYITNSAEETELLAERFVRSLFDRPGIQGNATIVGLRGELGAGKTTFMKGAARALDLTEHITSPTYVIEKVYDLPETCPFDRLIHIDAYRLESGDELAAIGFNEQLTNPRHLVFVEWPEMVETVIPLRAGEISFEVLDGNARKIVIHSENGQ